MINRVILMGRIVADPELKTTTSGISVTSFRIAVDRSYVKQGAERQADFFDIVAWRSTAEFVCRNFFKGSMIAIDGQLQSRQYQTKEGQSRTAIEVVAESASFTGERREKNPDLEYNPADYARKSIQYQQPNSQPQKYSEDPYRTNPANAFPYQQMSLGTPDDDLPF